MESLPQTDSQYMTVPVETTLEPEPTLEKIGRARDKIILDVGCGSRPRGTLNLDLFHGTSKHHKFDYDPRYIENFVNGDGAQLPYRDKSVDIIVSNHCLEHILNPLEAVKDWKRVARKKVIITVPNNPVISEHPAHLYSWSLVSFKNFLSKIFPEVKVWVNSPMHEMMQNRVFNEILKITLITHPARKFISKMWGLQITGLCYCSARAPSRNL